MLTAPGLEPEPEPGRGREPGSRQLALVGHKPFPAGLEHRLVEPRPAGDNKGHKCRADHNKPAADPRYSIQMRTGHLRAPYWKCQAPLEDSTVLDQKACVPS